MNKPSAEAMKAARELLQIPPQYISIEEGARALDTFAAKARAMAIEEAAQIADKFRDDCNRSGHSYAANIASNMAVNIRYL